MQGWVQFHRKMTESAVFHDPFLFKLWALCLFKASHKEHEVLVGRQVVKLQRGEFVTGREALASEYNQNMKSTLHVKSLTLWRWLLSLENMKMLNIKSNNKYSVVTVVNWDFYNSINANGEQQNEQLVNNKCTTNEQLMNTNNNGNKGNTEKKSKKDTSVAKIAFAEYVRLTQSEYDKLISDHGEKAAKKMIEVLDNYKGAKGATYKSDYRAILNWVVERVQKEHPQLFKKTNESHIDPFLLQYGRREG